jgi:hypothetical protein
MEQSPPDTADMGAKADSHGTVHEDRRALNTHIPDRVFRFSVGLVGPEDVIANAEQALGLANPSKGRLTAEQSRGNPTVDLKHFGAWLSRRLERVG